MDSRTDLGAKPTSTRPIAILSPFSAIPAPNPPATGQPLSVSPKKGSPPKHLPLFLANSKGGETGTNQPFGVRKSEGLTKEEV